MRVDSLKSIQAHKILGKSAWSKDGEAYRKAMTALKKLSLSDLQNIALVALTESKDQHVILSTTTNE